MRKKTFIVYFGKGKNGPDPFLNFGKKRDVYHALFAAAHKKGHDIFIASGKGAYLGGRIFSNLLGYDGEKFIMQKGEMSADAVFDRSGSLQFPSDELDCAVLNMISFKKLCADKFATFECIGKWMAKSYLVDCPEALQEKSAHFSRNEIVVLKPVNGMQGKNILIQTAEKIKNIDLPAGKYVLQEFVDTSAGISGIVTGRHDLRIVIADGEIVLSHVRRPKEGGYMANVALGGSIAEVDLKDIPSFVIDAVKEIQQQIDNKFNKPLYSIDFGICNERPYVFEINDQIGFPDSSMKNKDIFIEGIIDSLERISR